MPALLQVVLKEQLDLEEDDQAGLAAFLERRVEEMVRTADARAEPPEGHERMLPLIRLRVGMLPLVRLRVGMAPDSVSAWPHVGLLARGHRAICRGWLGGGALVTGPACHVPAGQQLALASKRLQRMRDHTDTCPRPPPWLKYR